MVEVRSMRGKLSPKKVREEFLKNLQEISSSGVGIDKVLALRGEKRTPAERRKLIRKLKRVHARTAPTLKQFKKYSQRVLRAVDKSNRAITSAKNKKKK
jgi:hypothetical protein